MNIDWKTLVNGWHKYVWPFLSRFFTVFGALWLLIEPYMLFKPGPSSPPAGADGTVSPTNTLGLVIYGGMILVAVGIALVWLRLKAEFGSRVGVAVIGYSGTGKTTLIQRHFMHSTRKVEGTESLHPLSVIVTYEGRYYEIALKDYPGQQELSMREELRHDFRRGKSIRAVLFLLSFYPLDDQNQLIIPQNDEERERIIAEHVARQVRLYNQAIINEIISYSYHIEKIFVLLNQMDVLDGDDLSQKVRVAERYFEETIREIRHVISEQRTRRIAFEVLSMSATHNIEISPDRKWVGLRLVERILR